LGVGAGWVDADGADGAHVCFFAATWGVACDAFAFADDHLAACGVDAQEQQACALHAFGEDVAHA
jgi:hypothetical protein